MISTDFLHRLEEGNLEISNVHLVDVTTGLVDRDVVINISDELINRISKSVGKPRSANTTKKNTAKLWAIPGLIDSHVHLFEKHKWEDRGVVLKNFELAKDGALANITEALEVGVTCVRDVGAFSAFNNRLRDMIKTDVSRFKFRIISCGHHITMENGHMHDRGIKWDRNRRSLEELVSSEITAGADFIKVMNDDPIFNLSELKKIASVCKKMGRKFACHAFTKKTINLAFDAGADTIEHAVCYSEELCEKAIQKGVAICPTFVTACDSIDSQYIDEVSKLITDCTKQEFEEWAEFLHQHIPKTFKAGVKVIAGTDAGIFPTNFQSLPREIIHFSKLGATNLQALQSATIYAAEALDIADITGSLKLNKSADIVLLGKNPLDDFENAIRDVKIVISRGHIAINNIEV